MDIDDGCARNKYKCNHAKSRGRHVYGPPLQTVNCLLMALPSARPAASSILQLWIEIIHFFFTLSSEKECLTGEKYGSHRRMSSGGGIPPTGPRRECERVFWKGDAAKKNKSEKLKSCRRFFNRDNILQLRSQERGEAWLQLRWMWFNIHHTLRSALYYILSRTLNPFSDFYASSFESSIAAAHN